MVIGGEEGGAEKLGVHWARLNKIPCVSVRRLKFEPSGLEKTFAFFWSGDSSSYRRKESMLERNQRMLDENPPDAVLAFGTGKTTGSLIRDARARGIEVIQVDIPVNVVSAQLYQIV